MAKYIRTLTVFYDTEISSREIPFFRGAVLKSLGDKADLLYHNHTGAHTFRYSYPLIQYKRLGGKAAITCVEEGVNLVGPLLTDLNGPLTLGNREVFCRVADIHSAKTAVEIQEPASVYRIHQWLALNARNYAAYQSTDNLVERLGILQRVLVGNILSFLKGVDVHTEEKLEVHISDITDQHVWNYKDVKLMSFDICFKANISLPSYIGIGKNASIGNGVILRKATTNK